MMRLRRENCVDLEPTLKKNPKIYKRYKNAFRYIKKYTYKKTGKKGIYGFPVNLKSFDDKGQENLIAYPFCRNPTTRTRRWIFCCIQLQMKGL